MDLAFPDSMLDYVAKSVDAHLATGVSWGEVSPYNWQVIRALAYLLVHDRSPLKGSRRLSEAIADIYTRIERHAEPPGNRLVGHLAEARELLGPGGVSELMPNVDRVLKAGAEPLAEMLRSYAHLSHFTSANLGTGTNHVAVFCSSVYRVGMIWKNQNYMDLAASVMDRLAADMEPDGYWAETTGGPTPLYNTLTYCCVGRMARWTGNAAWREAALRGAQFHRRFCYPDGTDIETFDGRCRYGHVPMLFGGFVQSETPEGRALVLRKMATLAHGKTFERFNQHDGEYAALVCENHQLWVDGPIGKTESERTDFVEQMQIPGALRRQGPWVVSLQGIGALPRGWGTFTIDRTSIFSLWHEKTGLIVNGSGAPGEHAAQSFQFHLPTEKVQHVVPERARLAMGAAGSREPARIVADYRGGTAQLEAHFISPQELRVEASVRVRTDRYPIPFTLQLELRDGATVNGRTLSTEAFELSAKELNGRLRTDYFEVTFPSDEARFIWPHDPYNPYDLEHHQSARDKYVALLRFNVGPGGVKLAFRV